MIPANEGLRYYRQIWNKIINSDEIDVVNERKMIIEYSCLKAKQNCIKGM